MKTDATGRSFVSYKSSRRAEAELLLAAQHDRGIPTWQDRKNLDEVPTADELRRVLEDRFTSNAVLFITPEVSNSAVIRRIEYPGILNRVENADGFFLVPVSAGGLDYAGAAAAVDENLTAENLENWNLLRLKPDPITPADAAAVAARVLKRRVKAVNEQVDPGLPLRLQFHTRTTPAFQPGIALSVDWSGRFVNRETTADTWNSQLLPALAEVASAIRTEAPGRSVVANGLASVSATLALGAAFLAPSGLKISWSQYTAGREDQIWNIEVPREDTGFKAVTRDHTVSASDLAVFISVTDNVEPAFANTPKGSFPPFRAITKVSKPSCSRFDITTAGQAADIARTVEDGLREARLNFRPINTVHLFAAVPLGVAMMIGQLLNTFGMVQTYEHIPVDGTGIYRPAALLRPSF